MSDADKTEHLKKQLEECQRRERDLRSSAEKLRIMLESIREGVAVTDLDLNFVDMNGAMLRLYGFDRKGEIVGRNAFDFILPKDHAGVKENMKKTVGEGYGGEVEVRLFRKDSQAYDAEIHAALLKDSSGTPSGFIATTKDITDRKRAEAALLQRNRELAALNAIAQTVSQSLDLDEVLNNALDKTLEILDIKHGTIAFLDRDAGSLTLRTVRGISENDVKAISPIKMGEDIIGLVAESGEPLFVESLIDSAEMMRNYTMEIVRDQQLKSVIYVPLKAKGKTLGVMCTFTRGDRVFTPEEHKLLTTIGHEISAAIENAVLYEEVQRKEEIRGEVLKQAIQAQEEERRRIARELHDQTSQVLAYASAKTEAAIAGLPPDTDEVKARLKEVQLSLNGMFDDIHRIIYELRPTMLDDLGLVAAVRWHVEESLKRAGVRACFESKWRKRKLSAQLETALFRIIQEATTNIVRHAGAQNVTVRLEFKPDSVEAVIEDDGEGFDIKKVTSPRARKHGLGLLTMRERAEILNGTINIRSKRGYGTQTTIEIPTGQGARQWPR